MGSSTSSTQQSGGISIIAIIGVIAAIVAIVVFITGSAGLPQLIEKSNEKQIIGTWQDAEGKTMTFFDDNTFTSGGPVSVGGNYQFTDRNHLRIDFGLLGSRVYEVKFSGNTVTFTDPSGSSFSMQRVK